MNEKLLTELQAIYVNSLTEESAQKIAHILQEEGITSCSEPLNETKS
jgi:hypothetical protein